MVFITCIITISLFTSMRLPVIWVLVSTWSTVQSQPLPCVAIENIESVWKSCTVISVTSSPLNFISKCSIGSKYAMERSCHTSGPVLSGALNPGNWGMDGVVEDILAIAR